MRFVLSLFANICEIFLQNKFKSENEPGPTILFRLSSFRFCKIDYSDSLQRDPPLLPITNIQAYCIRFPSMWYSDGTARAARQLWHDVKKTTAFSRSPLHMDLYPARLALAAVQTSIKNKCFYCFLSFALLSSAFPPHSTTAWKSHVVR